MAQSVRIACLLALVALLLPLAAGAVVEEKTGTTYPDEITLTAGEDSVTLKATGVGLREKTFMKVDVYTIVSYLAADQKLEGKRGQALMELQAPKRLQMDLRRGFSREKLLNAFTEVIDKNYADQTAFAADIETFKGYFTRDAQEGDVIIFDFCPLQGLTTTLNGEVRGVIANKAFAEALWSVWFGKNPANGDLKKALLSAH